MLENKKFRVYAILFCVLGILLMFLYSGLSHGHYVILSAFSGWDDARIRAARTAAGFACAALAFIYGTLFIRLGVRRTLIPCIMLCALGCAGLIAADGLAVNMPQWQQIFQGADAADPPVTYARFIADNGLTGSVHGLFWLFSISGFLVRCCCLCLQMAAVQLAVNWFIRYRGRILGVVAAGAPLFSGAAIGLMTELIADRWGCDYRMFYAGIAVVLVLIAVLARLLLRDVPEEVGLYPDGSGRAPASEDPDREIRLPVGKVLSEKRAWLLIASYGAFLFVFVCCTSSLELRFLSEGGRDVWTGAPARLIACAVLAAVISCVFGRLADKLGAARASLILGCCEFIPVLTLMFMPEGGGVPMEIVRCFGIACILGGVPAMHPAAIACAYGRREYPYANRVILAIQLIPAAFAAPLSTALIRSGRGRLVYAVCLIVIVIGLAAANMLRKVPDATGAGRDSVKNC